MFQNLKTKWDPKKLLNVAAEDLLGTRTTAQATPQTPPEKPPQSPTSTSPVSRRDFNPDRVTKEQLVEEYRQQQQQLQRYRTKLRDMVNAYKTLEKEKGTLEQTLQALASAPLDMGQETEFPGSAEPEAYDSAADLQPVESLQPEIQSENTDVAQDEKDTKKEKKEEDESKLDVAETGEATAAGGEVKNEEGGEEKKEDETEERVGDETNEPEREESKQKDQTVPSITIRSAEGTENSEVLGETGEENEEKNANKEEEQSQEPVTIKDTKEEDGTINEGEVEKKEEKRDNNETQEQTQEKSADKSAEKPGEKGEERIEEKGTEKKEEKGKPRVYTQQQVDVLQKRVAALGQALANLTKEKNAMQVVFQEDKRSLLQSQRDSMAQATTKHERAIQELQSTHDRILRDAQQEHEQALRQKDLTIRNRDLALKEKELAFEKMLRAKDEALKTQTARQEEAKRKLVAEKEAVQKELLQLKSRAADLDKSEQAAVSQLNDRMSYFHEQINKLTDELGEKKKQLASCMDSLAVKTAECDSLTDRLTDLENEANDMKATHASVETTREGLEKERAAFMMALDQEKSRADRLDAELQTIEHRHRQHLEALAKERNELESQMEEMTVLVTEYESRRLCEQRRVDSLMQQIAQLREEVEVLETANKSLMDDLQEAKSFQSNTSLGGDMEVRSYGGGLLAEPAGLARVKKMGSEGSLFKKTRSLDTLNTATGGVATTTGTPGEGENKDQKNASPKPPAEGEKAAIGSESYTQDDVKLAVERALQEHEIEWRQQLEDLTAERDELSSECERLRQTRAEKEQEFESQLAYQREQNRSNRERALVIVEDKDKQIAELRAKLDSRPPALPQWMVKGEDEKAEEARGWQGSQMAADSSGVPLIFRMQMERAALKEQLQNALDKAEDCERQMEVLRQKIKQLEGLDRRENMNMEYLKNVVLKYMETAPGTAKEHLARAIATVLQFGPEETDRVLAKSQGSSSPWMFR
eukprot:comp23319_c1_seq2/m.38372 comp23319_c1_seq2/g.38372  ORF comp23319_c1_seq2/g.38372 comp23319_c1_seq2/m.38372 type:complete len:990 (-) comp23319_c1_seq2:7-2976(-)